MIKPLMSSRTGQPVWFVLLLVLLGGMGCAGQTSFSSTFPVNQPTAVSQVVTRAQQGGRARLPQVVLGVVDTPRALFAYDLEAQRLLFQKAAPVTGVPAVAGRFAVVPEGGSVQVLRLSDGASVASFPLDGMHLIGADGDGSVTAIVLSTGGSMGARSKLIIMEGEQVSSTTAIPRHVGGPAVLGGLVFVPHNRVHMSAVDPKGHELARVQVREDVASQAFTSGGDVYFGLGGIYRFDDKAPLGASGGAHYFKLELEEKLPGQPAFLPNTADPAPAVESAVHRVSLSFVPEMRGDALKLLENSLYLLFYKQLYALDASSNGPQWARQLESDAVGLRAVPGGVLVVEESGKVSALGAQGALTWSAQMGVRPVVARIQATDLPQGAPTEEPAPLTMQLVDAALNPDTRLVPARMMAVSMLARLQDEEATPALIEICQDRGTPDRVRKVACAALSKRTTGSSAIAAALDRHANFLEQTKAPPVGPLAEAAMRSGDVSVVPLLLAHLADPETPTDELPALMLALKQLATLEAAPKLAEFLRLYHADADEPRMVDALVIGIDALRKLQGAAAQPVLEPIANDAFAPPAVRAAAGQALAANESNTAPEATAAVAPEASDQEPQDQGPPEHRTALHAEVALRPVATKLSECVRRSPKRPNVARLTIVLSGDGEVLAVETLPTDVKACVQPLVLSVPFPANKYGRRETITYSVPR